MVGVKETTPALSGERLEEMKHLLDGLNNRSAVVFFLINEDLSDYERFLQLKSEAKDLRMALKAVSHCFGRLHSEYVSTLEDGEESGGVPS